MSIVRRASDPVMDPRYGTAMDPGTDSGQPAGRNGRSDVRIMVVDDNEIDRMVAETFVSDLGYSVITASSGIQCLQLLQDYMRAKPTSSEPPVHLILLDVLMPQMDGYETLKKMKDEKRLRTIPVIMVRSRGMF